MPIDAFGMYVLVLLIFNGPSVSISTIPDFKIEAECELSRTSYMGASTTMFAPPPTIPNTAIRTEAYCFPSPRRF